MKLYNKFIFGAILSVGLITGACQEEVTDIIEPQSESVITSQSTVSGLIQQATMKDGSFDNIIDHSSCLTIELPVTVIANGENIVVATEEDYKLIERIFDESDIDEDVLVIEFPITVIMSDYKKVEVEDEDDLEEMAEECLEGGDDEDIECLDFVYPLTISTYDVANQISDVISVENDEGLYTLFESIDENDLLSFSFPITMVLLDGNEIMVEDNDELEELIEDVADDCDEDDDDDYNDDDIEDADFVQVLLNGEWAITYFFDDVDETGDFQGFVFTFYEDNTALADQDGSTVNGVWHSYGDDGSLELLLDFGPDSPLDELMDDWDIVEYGENIIKLKDISGGDGSEEYLTFERPEEDGGGEEKSLSEVIIVGVWKVANYNDSGVDETGDYTGYTLTFSSDGNVVATNGTNTINGTWSEFIEDGITKLGLDFATAVPFDEFNDDWDLLEFTENRIDLQDISGGDGSTDTLVFEKI